MKENRSSRTRSVDIPVSDQALLNALPQGRNVGGQVVHVLRRSARWSWTICPCTSFSSFSEQSAPHSNSDADPSLARTSWNARNASSRSEALSWAGSWSLVPCVAPGRLSEGRFCLSRDHLRSSRVI